MTAIRRVVIATLLAIWCFPAASMASPSPRAPAPVSAQAGSPVPASAAQTSATESGTLASREEQAKQLQDFKGGRVYVVIGSGVLVVVLVVILILLLV